MTAIISPMPCYTEPPACPQMQLVRSINEDRWMTAADKLVANPHLTDVIVKGPKDEWSWYLKRTETKGVFLRNTYRGGVIAACSTMDINVTATNIEDNIYKSSLGYSTDCETSFKAKNRQFTVSELIHILQTIVKSNPAAGDLPVCQTGESGDMVAYSGGVELDIYGNVTISPVD